MDDEAGCGICEDPPELGAFEGQHTDDAEPGQDGWRWCFAAGQVLFSTDSSSALDGSKAVGYCGCCGQAIRADRGLAPDAPLYVYVIHN